jgi:hypothetical protein
MPFAAFGQEGPSGILFPIANLSSPSPSECGCSIQTSTAKRKILGTADLENYARIASYKTPRKFSNTAKTRRITADFPSPTAGNRNEISPPFSSTPFFRAIGPVQTLFQRLPSKSKFLSAGDAMR